MDCTTWFQMLTKYVTDTISVKNIHRATCSASRPETSRSIFNMRKPKATPRTTLRTARTIKTTGARVIRVSTGTKAKETPNMAAAPLPPRNPRNTGQLCPATTKVVVTKPVQWGAPSQMGTNTASMPFPASTIKTGMARHVPTCW